MSNVAMNQAAMAQFGNVSRFSGGTQFAGYQPADEGSDAFNGRRSVRGANNGNFIGTALTIAAVGIAAIAGFALTKRLFTPSILKEITSLRAVVAEEGGAIVNNTFKFASKEADKEVTGTVKYLENSGFLGFFKKAEIIVDGGATRTVGMWRVPTGVKEILKASPEQLGVMGLKWDKIADAGIKLGEHTIPAGAQTTNVLGQTIAAVKTSATEATMYVKNAAGEYVPQVVGYDALPSALRSFFITG